MDPNSLTHKESGKSRPRKKRKRKGYSKLEDSNKPCSDEDYLANKVKQGWLDKQSRHTKLWKRRWCILEGLELNTYRDKKDDSGNVFDDINTPTVTIDLSKCQSCEYTDDLFEKHPFVFYLQCGALERYFFKAASHIDRLEWMLAIQRILRQKQRRDIQKLIQTDCTEYARILAIENGHTSRILSLNQKVNDRLKIINASIVVNQDEQENPNPQVSGDEQDITISMKSAPSYDTTKQTEDDVKEITVEIEDRPVQCCSLL